MATTATPVLDFVLRNYKNFNARATRDALIAYWKHIDGGGRMWRARCRRRRWASPWPRPSGPA